MLLMTNENLPTELRGTRVRFRIVDVLVPPAEELMHQLFGHDLLEGLVVDVTRDRGPQPAHVAVKVATLAEPLLVPRSQLLPPSRSPC
jgi:hypothetical protein